MIHVHILVAKLWQVLIENLRSRSFRREILNLLAQYQHRARRSNLAGSVGLVCDRPMIHFSWPTRRVLKTRTTTGTFPFIRHKVITVSFVPQNLYPCDHQFRQANLHAAAALHIHLAAFHFHSYWPCRPYLGFSGWALLSVTYRGPFWAIQHVATHGSETSLLHLRTVFALREA